MLNSIRQRRSFGPKFASFVGATYCSASAGLCLGQSITGRSIGELVARLPDSIKSASCTSEAHHLSGGRRTCLGSSQARNLHVH